MEKDVITLRSQFSAGILGRRPRSNIIDFLLENSEFTRILEYAVEWEENPKHKERLGWTNYDVHAHRKKVDKLVFADIAKVTFHSSKHINFRLMNITAVKEALDVFRTQQIKAEEEEEVEIPEDIFSIIVGYEDIKKVIHKSLTSEKPVPCLLVGPVATAKTLFLEEINRIRGSSYHLGSSTSKAGFTQFLLVMRPTIVVLDELDKMNREDYAALLSLMESGKVVETKYGRRSEEHMNVWVFAACNRTKGIPQENISRFPFQFYFKEYTREQYAEVVFKALTQRERVKPALAKYIAEKSADYTKDVRKAVGIGRVCKTPKEVDQLIETLRKYKGI